MTTEDRLVFPRICWELIFRRLAVNDLKPISFVCKELFSISNDLCLRLIVSGSSLQFLSRLLERFKHIKKVDLMDLDGEDLDEAIHKMLGSGFDLEILRCHYKSLCDLSLRKILAFGLKNNSKSLDCSWVFSMCDHDLSVIANTLPGLTELDIMYRGGREEYSKRPKTVTDEGIEVLASKLQGLQKINISGNYVLSDRSLVSLSSKCVFLTEIKASGCRNMTLDGFLFSICHRDTLASLSMSPIDSGHITYAKPSLECCHVVNTDTFLCSIVKVGVDLRLKNLRFSYCKNLTLSGITSFLHQYQSLTSLKITGARADFLTDQSINELSLCLLNLKYIEIRPCFNLTNSSFFYLAKNCTFLEAIHIEGARLGKESMPVDLGKIKNHYIQSLNLADNKFLNDKFLKKIRLVCPNLKCLNLNCCPLISSKGVGKVLKSCKKIKELTLFNFKDTKIFGEDLEVSELELENLFALHSCIDDEGIAVIAKRCPKLCGVNLWGCNKLTEKGLKDVMVNCKQLRKVELPKQIAEASIREWAFTRPF